MEEGWLNLANPCKAFVGNLLAWYFLIILGAKVKSLSGKYFFVLLYKHRCQRKFLNFKKYFKLQFILSVILY